MFSANARKFVVKAWKFLITAQKIFLKFNAICSRPSVFSPGFDVNSSLQVESRSMFDSSAFSLDLLNPDHVKLFE